MIISRSFSFLSGVTGHVYSVSGSAVAGCCNACSRFLQGGALLQRSCVHRCSTRRGRVGGARRFVEGGVTKQGTGVTEKQRGRLSQVSGVRTLRRGRVVPRFRFPILPLAGARRLLIGRLTINCRCPILSSVSFDVGNKRGIIVANFGKVKGSALLGALVKRVPSVRNRFGFSSRIAFKCFRRSLV